MARLESSPLARRDSEGLEGVNALQVRNGLRGVTQREQSVAELQVRGVQIGA